MITWISNETCPSSLRAGILDRTTTRDEGETISKGDSSIIKRPSKENGKTICNRSVHKSQNGTREICNGRECGYGNHTRCAREYWRREGVFAWKAKRVIQPHGIDRRRESPIAETEFSEDFMVLRAAPKLASESVLPKAGTGCCFPRNVL
jgi:hypothetical protein